MWVRKTLSRPRVVVGVVAVFVVIDLVVEIRRRLCWLLIAESRDRYEGTRNVQRTSVCLLVRLIKSLSLILCSFYFPRAENRKPSAENRNPSAENAENRKWMRVYTEFWTSILFTSGRAPLYFPRIFRGRASIIRARKIRGKYAENATSHFAVTHREAIFKFVRARPILRVFSAYFPRIFRARIIETSAENTRKIRG